MKNKHKILCIIPARGGSKGVKKKNIRDFNGRPLIAWTIQTANESKWIDRVVVSTEDEEIESVSIQCGAEVIKRPLEMAQDNSPSIDALLYTIGQIEKKGWKSEYVVSLQCTSPLRTAFHVDEAVEKMLVQKDKVDSLISVTKEEHPPWWLKRINEKGLMEDFISYDKSKWTRRQEFPEVYGLNGAIYIAKTDALYKHKTFDTPKTMPYEMEGLVSIDIDSEIDFVMGEYLQQHVINKM